MCYHGIEAISMAVSPAQHAHSAKTNRHAVIFGRPKGAKMFDTIRRVEALARYQNVSLCHLCEIGGLNYSTISSAKSRNGQLSLDSIERLCEAANISLSIFFSSEDDTFSS